jgi:hypothetical protein
MHPLSLLLYLVDILYKKRVSLETPTVQQQSKLSESLKNKPFWIWNIEEHKQEDIKTNLDCCFNYMIGLPQNDGINKPLYDYEGIIFDSLVKHNCSTNSYSNEYRSQQHQGLGWQR